MPQMIYNCCMSKQDLKQKECWTVKEKFPKDYLKNSGFSDLEKQLLFNRGIKNTEEADKFLNPDYDELHDPFLMKGMSEAVERVGLALDNKDKVVVYGDYDVDGITAAAILYETLSALGLETDYYIPKRDSEGYGLNNDALTEISAEGATLCVTVDCGITGVEEVECAKKLGLDIIITDHHNIPGKSGKQVVPDAIVVNPKQKDCKYPFGELSGSGIAFKIAQALYKTFPEKLLQGQEKWLLDLAALGTVCDVVPLTGENRIIASFGNTVMAKTKRVGLKLLAEVSGINLQEITSYHLGFQLGPRLNAAGRLETAEKSIQLLLERDENAARVLALELDNLNKERQGITKKILEEAVAEIEKKDKAAKIYLLANKNWPAGVVGIIASRLADKYARPAIIFEDKGDLCQGSARSPKCFNIIEALEENADILVRCGGHARAAGVTVKKEHFVLLEEKLLEISGKKITEEDLVEKYEADAETTIQDIGEGTYGFIQRMEPFGMGNSSPLFIGKGLRVDSFRKVGKDGEHLKLSFTDGNEKRNGIFFSYFDRDTDLKKTVDTLFSINQNEWGGRISYEMRCVAIRNA